MSFMKQRQALLPKDRGRGWATFLLALLVAGIMFAPSIIAGQGYFLFYGDFNVQQIPFYRMCHDAVREGRLGWSFGTDLGANFIGSYSFYLLGSPFFWLTIPFESDMVPYLMGPLLILKFACAALTAYLYLRRFTRTARAAQLGGLLYAFSSFSVYNIFFNHFHEPLIMFPLLLLSFEWLFTENRRGVFALCVALAAVVNYYFFFGMVVFLVLYWFFRRSSGAIEPKRGRFFSFLIEGVLGVLLSAFLLLPSVMAVAGNSRVSELQNGWSAILYGREQIYFQIFQSLFFPPDLPARPVFCPGIGVKWSSIAAWLPVVGMSGVLAYGIAKKGSWLKKILVACAIMAGIPVLNSLFSALNSAYYARWFYMPILLMVLATLQAMDDESIDWEKGWRVSALFTVLVALVVGLFPQKQGDELVFGLYEDAGSTDKTFLLRFIISCAIALLSLLICRGLVALKPRRKTMFRAALCGVCVISIAFGTVFLHDGQQHSSAMEGVMIDALIESKVTLPDSQDCWRIDVYDGEDNTGMFLGYDSINAFHSVVPPSIMDFYTFIGQKRDVASRPDTSVWPIRSLLSVKYLLNLKGTDRFVEDDGTPKMPGFSYINTSGGYYVYENQNYIPYGFSYDYYMTESECELLFEKEQRPAQMLKAMIVPDDCSSELTAGMTHYSQELFKGEVTLESMVERDDRPYEVNGHTDEKTLSKDAAHLAESSATLFKKTKNGFKAMVQRSKSNLVFFSIPYDEGWRCTVNGTEAPIVKANVGFMAVSVPAGSSEIVFTYKTPYLTTGCLVSLLGLALFLLYLPLAVLSCKRRERRRERKGLPAERYAEGEALLADWSKIYRQQENGAPNQEEPLHDEEDFTENEWPFDGPSDSQKQAQPPRYQSGFRVDFFDDPLDKPKDQQ